MSKPILHNNCILCGSSSLKNIFGDNHFITKCNSCSFVFSRKIATNEEILEYYSVYPIADKISELTIQRYNEILDIFEPYRKTGKLLEFGCGEGYFLTEAKKRNWNVTGIEISETLIAKCNEKKLVIYNDLSKLPVNEVGQFDIIVTIEVIEHLSPPIYFAKKFNALLRQGGGLYMTTPNFNCLLRYFLGERWNNIIFPEHLCYYSSSTMKKMLTSCGFKENFTRTTGISLARYKYALLNWKKKKNDIPILYDYNENDRKIREKIENKYLLTILKNILNMLFDLTKLGESLKIFYIKK